jgi:hypothetical protein
VNKEPEGIEWSIVGTKDLLPAQKKEKKGVSVC